jgi:hypothetical protein
VASATLTIAFSPLGIMIGAIASHGVATVVCTHMNGIQSGVSTLLLTIVRHLFVHHICTQFFYLVRFGNTFYKEVIVILCFVVGCIRRFLSWHLHF